MTVSAAQREVCRRFSVDPQAPVPGTMVAVAPSRGRDELPLHALRHPPAGNGNGWFLWRGDEIPQDDDAFFVPSHVEHVADLAPDLLPYLALPPGWRVLLAPDYEDVWFDADILDV
ncbi:immunity protein Imm33 domain-containing protein [Dactylosporangium cerinum]